MMTYGNGELCSWLLYTSINRLYLERVENYYSYAKANQQASVVPYFEKDGEYIKAYPPLGDGIQDTDLWSGFVKCQHTVEDIRSWSPHAWDSGSRSCSHIISQDHTHEVTKNYFQKKRLGAMALWDVATETGEIAAAVLVPSTKTIHLLHAAKQLSRQINFLQSAVYSKFWPVKNTTWSPRIVPLHSKEYTHLEKEPLWSLFGSQWPLKSNIQAQPRWLREASMRIEEWNSVNKIYRWGDCWFKDNQDI